LVVVLAVDMTGQAVVAVVAYSLTEVFQLPQELHTVLQ
jgi:hypothetical protein